MFTVVISSAGNILSRADMHRAHVLHFSAALESGEITEQKCKQMRPRTDTHALMYSSNFGLIKTKSLQVARPFVFPNKIHV